MNPEKTEVLLEQLLKNSEKHSKLIDANRSQDSSEVERQLKLVLKNQMSIYQELRLTPKSEINHIQTQPKASLKDKARLKTYFSITVLLILSISIWLNLRSWNRISEIEPGYYKYQLQTMTNRSNSEIEEAYQNYNKQVQEYVDSVILVKKRVTLTKGKPQPN